MEPTANDVVTKIVASDSVSSATNRHQETSRRALILYRYPLLWLVLSWMIGISLAKLVWADFHGLGWPLLLIIALTLIVAIASQRRSGWLSCALTFLAAVLTAIWFAMLSAPITGDSLSPLASGQGQPIALRGTVASPAEWKPNTHHRPDQPESQPWSTSWIVDWQEIRQLDQWTAIKSRSKLSVVGRIDRLLPGDFIQVFGELQSIPPPTNPGMYDFAARSQQDGILVRVDAKLADQIQCINAEWFGPYLVSRMRGLAVRAVDRSIHRYVCWGQAPLASALVFGQRSQVDWEDQQQLMATGTLHMLAISGMHVEMVAAALLVLCALLSIRPLGVLIMVVGACVCYAGLAGGNPPVMRAVILVTCFAFAQYWGLKARMTNLLSLAGCFLLVSNPHNLQHVGVQLSFLAVATISIVNSSRESTSRDSTAFQELLESEMSGWKQKLLSAGRSLQAGAKISFWVWLVTTPLIWHHFHIVSPVAVPLNVVLAPPLMVGLLSGLVTGLLGWIPPIGWLAGQIAGGSLGMISGLVELSSWIPLGHWWLPSPPLWWSCIFYAVCLIWLLVFATGRMSGLALLLLGWILLGIWLYVPGPRGMLGWPAQASPADPELRCTFVDVGHGTSAVLELPDGRVWLYDAGSLGDELRSHQPFASVLWQLPTARIDTLIVSHADSDHYNAVVGLVKRFSIGQVVSTQQFWSNDSPGAQRISKTLKDDSIPIQTWNAGTQVELSDGAIARVLHPKSETHAESDNAHSLCLEISYAGIRLLLPGDIEGSGLQKLCELPPRRCQIIMAPHHGSLSHDPEPLLRWCQPEFVAISGGQRTAQPAVTEKYASVPLQATTFRHGAIQVRIQADGSFETLHWGRSGWKPLNSD